MISMSTAKLCNHIQTLHKMDLISKHQDENSLFSGVQKVQHEMVLNSVSSLTPKAMQKLSEEIKAFKNANLEKYFNEICFKAKIISEIYKLGNSKIKIDFILSHIATLKPEEKEKLKSELSEDKFHSFKTFYENFLKSKL
jgi:hypothetical protein